MKDFKNYFCRVCSLYRIGAGLSFQDISKMCGKSPSAVFRYEHGDTNSIDIFMFYILHFNIDILTEYKNYIDRRLNNAEN